MRFLLLTAVCAVVLAASKPARAAFFLVSRVLENPTATPGAYFGASVAVAGARIAVGAPADEPSAAPGIAFLFDETGALPLSRLPADGDQFGFAVAAAGPNVVVGVPFGGTGVENAGIAYLFDAATGSFVRELRSSTPGPGDRFGFAVAADAAGARIVIGAPGDDTGGEDAGVAFVFDGDPTSPKFGESLTTLRKEAPAPADQFGAAVAIDDRRIVVGAPFDSDSTESAGAVYVFDHDGNSLGKIEKEHPAADDLFGASVALVNGGILVGAPLDDAAAPDAGAAYLFDDRLPTPRQFVDPTTKAGEQFGSAVTALGTRAVIGAPLADSFREAEGIAFVLDADVGSAHFGEAEQSLASTNATGQGRFGVSAATGGDTLVVGAPGEGMSAGRAYVFVLSRCDEMTCDDQDPCTDDLCDPFTNRCEFVPRDCAAVGNCVTGFCDHATGECRVDLCDCSSSDPCIEALIIGGDCVKLPACNDGNPCTLDVCHPDFEHQTFTCEFPDDPSVECNDHNDVCGDGCDPNCRVSGCGNGFVCFATGEECDDGNTFPGDGCEPDCTTTPASTTTTTTVSPSSTTSTTTVSTSTTTTLPTFCMNDRDCNDQSPCNGEEYCRSCVGCFLHRWPCCASRARSRCVRGQAVDGIQCSDGNACTVGDGCSGGTCVPGAPRDCDDRNACTSDGCNRFACGDSSQGCDPCTHDPLSGCQLCTQLADCPEDNNPCRVVVCEGTCRSRPVPDGTPCSDTDPCNGAETCQAGVCTAGSALACDDANPCTRDSCEPGIGCQHLSPDRFGMVGCKLAEQFERTPCTTIPETVSARSAKAGALVEAAGTKATRRDKRRVLSRAIRFYRSAAKAVRTRARTGEVTVGCKRALLDLIAEAIKDVKVLRRGR